MMTRNDNIDFVVDANIDMLNQLAASKVVDVLRDELAPVLGFATGGTPVGMYKKLVERSTETNELLTRWANVTAFNLDEYVGLSPNHPQSYHQYMHQHLYQHVPIQRSHVYIPDTTGDLHHNCKKYDQALALYGWPHLQVLGIGANGHIGFNEPGPALALNTHVTKLSPSTREANARFFESLDAVPKEAITMGMGSILRARKIILLAYGAEKREALRKALSGVIRTDCPASFLQLHTHLTIFTDQDINLSAT